MLSENIPSGFYTVKAISFITIALVLLMSVAVFGAVDSRLDFFGSFKKILGYEKNIVAIDRPASRTLTYGSATDPLLMVTPTLGNYSNSSILLSTNTTVTPDATPTNAARMTVSTNTNFKGTLEGDPSTGVVRVSNAHPAGSYFVTVKAFDSGGLNATKTFTLTVTIPTTCGVSFATPAPTFSVDTDAYSVVVGDFNRDGKQDIASAGAKSENASILLGNGSGGFSGPTNFEVGDSPGSMAVADLNGDGKQDIVFGRNPVAILFGNGDGTFATVTTVNVAASSVAVGDFNGDGKKDIAITNNALASVLLGDGTGSFGSPTNFNVGDDPVSVAVGDFNGDGKHDIVTANNVGENVSILLGNGAGGFGSASNFSTSTPEVLHVSPDAVIVADFNDDGNQDIATANGANSNFSVLFGNGAGSFTQATLLGALGDLFNLLAADFNGDGFDDIAGAEQVNVPIYLSDPHGGFYLSPEFNPASAPYSLAVGDFNGDGKQDLATGNIVGASSVSIYIRNCTSVSGTVTYGNAIGAPTPRNVSNVTVSVLVGSHVDYDSTSYPGGTYFLEGFGIGFTSVTPIKTYNTGINGSITSFDAAKISQHVAGTTTLNSTQLIVADVSGNGTVSSNDAALVSRYAINNPAWGYTANWIFDPTSRIYPAVTTNLTDQDFSALLLGEVSGNWTNSSSRPARVIGPEKSTAVSVPHFVTSANKEVVIPVSVEGVANKDIIAYEFDLRYDPSVIQPQADPVDLAGTASRDLTAVTNVLEPGLLRVVVYGPTAISQNGLLLNLRFTAIGTPGSASPLTWERIMFNEDADGTIVTDGKIELF